MDGHGETTIFEIKIWFIIQLKQPFKKWMAFGYEVVIRATIRNHGIHVMMFQPSPRSDPRIP